MLRLVVGLVIGLPAQAAAAQTPDETVAIIREAAATYGVSGDWMVAIARCESRFDVRAVGRLGEQGLFQLRSPGERDRFYARGYTNVWDAAQQAAFTAERLAEGAARAWTCAR